MELIYLLFIISGWLKAYWGIIGLPAEIDLTVIFGMILILDIFFNRRFIISNSALISLVLLTSFYLWMLFTLFYTPSKSYSYQKSFYFLQNFIALGFPFFKKEFDVTKFIKQLVCLTLLLSFFNIIVILGYKFDLIRWENYLAWKPLYLKTGMFMGLNIVLLFVSHFRLFIYPLKNYLLFIFSYLFMFISAARGPIIFSAIIMILYYLFFWKKYSKIRLQISKNGSIVLSIVAIFLISFFNTFFSRAILRFEKLFNSFFETNGGEKNIRIRLLEDSWDVITESFQNFVFGQGIGSFSFILYGTDIKYYPHNILIEILFEFGIIGFILFFIFLFFSLHKVNKYNILLFGFLFIFFNALKSYSLVDIRIFFALISLIVIHKNTNKKVSFF